MPETPPLRHDAYAAWRHRDYRIYSISSLLTAIGVQAQSVALTWELYDRTGEPLSLALVALMQAVPALGLALPAGYLADRFDRRWLIVAIMAMTTLTSLALAYLSWQRAPVVAMYGVLFADASLMSLARPARQSLLPALVPRPDFPNAVAWRTSLFQTSSFIGPALGGFIVAWSTQAAYLLCAATTLVGIYAHIALHLRFREIRTPTDPPSWRTVMAGFGFLGRSPILLSAITLDMFAVLLGGATYLMPIFARDILHVGAAGLGWLNAAPAAGALVTAFALAHMPPMLKAGRNLLGAVVGFGIATIVFGLSQNFTLSLAMLFLIGAFDSVSVVVRHTLVQLLTPDEVRGRLNAVNGMFISTSNQIGGLESGLVAQLLGPVVSVVAGGVGTLLVVGVIAGLSPRLRQFGSLHDAIPEQSPQT